MSKKVKKVREILTHATLWDVYAAVAVICMQIVENWQYAEEASRTKSMDGLTKTLHTQLTVMAQASMEYEELLRLALINLPEGIVAVQVKNPLYDDSADESSDLTDDSSSGGLGDIPF